MRFRRKVLWCYLWTIPDLCAGIISQLAKYMATGCNLNRTKSWNRSSNVKQRKYILKGILLRFSIEIASTISEHVTIFFVEL